MTEEQASIQKKLEAYKWDQLGIIGDDMSIKEWQERIKRFEPFKPMANECIREMKSVLRTFQDKKAEAQRKCAEVVELIDSIEDADQCEILTLRYVEDKKIEEIADILHYSDKTILRKHKQALDALAERFEPLP